MMPGVNYVYMVIQELNTGGNIIAVITQDRVTDDNLKR